MLCKYNLRVLMC